jgi:hypothetical protein
MATTETKILDEMIVASRRRMMTMGGTALAGLLLGGATQKVEAQSTALTDADYLNFALNLEYLEAQYYTLADSGQTIDMLGIGIGGGSSVKGTSTVTVKPSGVASCQVPFTNPAIAAYASEIATEERKHVTFLRGALGSAAVAMPDLDLYNSFNAAAAAAGIGSSFDPFATELNFLLGSYIFEDVGVSAYHGAAGLLTSTADLIPAVGIHAVEAYHAGLIRTVLWGLDQGNPAVGIAGITVKISNLRATLDGTATATAPAVAVPDDIGLMTELVSLNTATASFTASTIVNADSNTIGWSRTPQQVLNIVYASPTGVKGGFYRLA